MGNGHTARNGRGNRRSRRGSPQPPSSANGQPRTQHNTAIPAPQHATPAPRFAERRGALSLDAASQPDTSERAQPPHQEPQREPLATGHSAETPDEQAGMSPPSSTRHRFDRRGPKLIVPSESMQRQPEQAASASAPSSAPTSGSGHEHANGNGHAHVPSQQPAAPQSGTSRFVVTPAAHQPRAENTTRVDEEGDDDPAYEIPRRDVRGEVGPLIDSLHTVFERDRGIASQGGAKRCGICYLHFPMAELEYREVEGFYVCAPCADTLRTARIPMVRRQQR